MACICSASLTDKSVIITSTDNFKVIDKNEGRLRFYADEHIKKKHPQYDSMGIGFLCQISTTNMNHAMPEIAQQLSDGLETQFGMSWNSSVSRTKPNEIYLLPSQDGIITLIITKTDTPDVFDVCYSYISNKANHQVDPIVKTPVDEVEAQGTQAHP
jgi:hypothetical protein